jgi:hypothetical protein
MGHGHSRAYLVARVRAAGADDLADAIVAGKISAHAVAVQLGWIKPAPRLTSGTTNQQRRNRHRLDDVLREIAK